MLFENNIKKYDLNKEIQILNFNKQYITHFNLDEKDYLELYLNKEKIKFDSKCIIKKEGKYNFKTI